MAESEYMVRTRGYIQSLEDIEHIPLEQTDKGIPVLLRDIAHIQVGPEMRRVVADLDGEGEVTGGIVVMRHGENALQTIAAVKEKLRELQSGLPEGVEIVTTYDRSELILRAVDNLTEKLVEEFIVVALVCLVFLFHLRSAFVAVVTLPLGILISFIIMKQAGINANIMSLGGIAIAIGAMVDAAIVMIENAHKHLEKAGPDLTGKQRWETITRAAQEVGPALFLFTAHHHPEFRSRVHAGGTGGPAVCAARVHQDICHGRIGRARGYAGAGADGLFHSRTHSRRVRQSAQPVADLAVPACTEAGAGRARK